MVVYRGQQEDTEMRPADKDHYIEMEEFRQEQGRINTEIRRLERVRNSLNESVLEIETKLSKMNEEAELCRRHIETHMDMCHATYNDHLKQATAAKQNTKELVQEKKELLAKQQQLRQKGKTAEADRMNKDIAKLDEDITKGKAETEKHREKFHDNQKKTMENAEAKALYDRFRSEAKRGEAKTYVDNDGRVIQAVLEMDAKQVFDYLAENKATVRFSNGETLDLLIDEQLPVHPRTIKQLYYEIPANPMSLDTGPRPIEDFREILKLTTDFKARLLEASVFREKVNKILQKHRMCTLDEVEAWKQDIDKVLTNSSADRRLFENMTPAEAFRLKTVMEFNGRTPDVGRGESKKELHEKFKIAKVAAGVRLAKDLKLHGQIFGTADCIEIIAHYARDKAANLKSQWEAVKNNTGLSSEQKISQFERLRREYGIIDSTWQYTTYDARAWKMEYTTRLNQENSSDYRSMVTELQNEMQDVKNFCRKATHRFGDKLSATSHYRKHFLETLDYFREHLSETLEQHEQELKIYFEDVPNVLFAANNRPFTFLQNGLTIKSTWKLDAGYFGVKSQPYVPYTEYFVNTDGSVNTHFFNP